MSFLEHWFQGIAFGLMDGVITLLGILIGMASATGDAGVVVIAGVVGGVANSFGNAIGFYTSESAERGQQMRFYEKRGKKLDGDEYVHSQRDVLLSAGMAFLATLVALVLPITPFFLLSSVPQAMLACVVISVAMLFLLGSFIGKLNKECGWRNGLKFVLLGLAGAAIAFLLGAALKGFLGG